MTYEQLVTAIHAILPDARFDIDENEQIIVCTGLKETGDMHEELAPYMAND